MQSRRQMRQPNAVRGLVAFLSAGPGATEDLRPAVAQQFLIGEESNRPARRRAAHRPLRRALLGLPASITRFRSSENPGSHRVEYFFGGLTVCGFHCPRQRTFTTICFFAASMIQYSSTPNSKYSSGFSSSRFERWYDKKYNEYQSKRQWVKCHVMCGVKTNVITAVDIGDFGDSPQLPGLLATTRQDFDVREVCADKAYSSKENLQVICDAGAVPYIPFKSNATDATGGSWAKAFHFFHLHQEAFKARYHQRSNIESTFSMLKAKFGDSLRSKTDVAMRNELLCKVLCHNIVCIISAMFELGIEPDFWAESTSAQELTA